MDKRKSVLVAYFLKMFYFYWISNAFYCYILFVFEINEAELVTMTYWGFETLCKIFGMKKLLKKFELKVKKVTKIHWLNIIIQSTFDLTCQYNTTRASKEAELETWKIIKLLSTQICTQSNTQSAFRQRILAEAKKISSTAHAKLMYGFRNKTNVFAN